jgi:heptosyltransferase II
MKKEEVNTILFITLSNLGDIILTTPVITKLHREFPLALIDVVTGPPGEPIFKSYTAVRDVIVRRKRSTFSERISEIRTWRDRKYDVVVDLKNSLVPYLTASKRHTSLFLRERSGEHKRDTHLSRLRSLGVDNREGADFFIPVSREEMEFTSGVLAGAVTSTGFGGKTVIVNPGAKSHLKRWGCAKYASLADRLISELGCTVLVTGNEDDKDVVKNTLKKMEQRPVDICGKTSLGSLFEVMRRSDLVITNDSAPLHVASAANAPTIAVFGPSDERKYGPLAEKSVVVKPSVPCRPCEKALCATGPDEGCISGISVDEVFAAAKRILQE